MTSILNRNTETISVEPVAGIDGQGKPTYGAAYEIQARVVTSQEIVKLPNGEESMSMASLWISSDNSPLPNTDDRITTVSGLVGIVMQRSDRKRLSNTLDHIKVLLREE